MYKLIFTKAFERDLTATLEYISQMLDNPSAAQRLLKNVLNKISQIEENPFVYQIYHGEELAEKNYRYIVISNYLLFYRAEETEKAVYISRFLYGRQNITAEFSQ